MNPKPVGPDTICWYCRNVGKRLCPWDDSKGSEPTPGWTAIPQTLRLDRKRVGTSYIVLECPLADLEGTEIKLPAEDEGVSE